VAERDHLDVDVRVVEAERLDAELPVLSVPAPLGSLVPEQRCQVPDLPWLLAPPLHVGAHDGRRPFGPQCEASAAAVGELVHLLADDVRRFADPLEHLDVLEDRGDDQLVAEPARPVGEGGDDTSPPRRLRRKDIVRADRRAVGVGVSRHRGIVPAVSPRGAG
jgi:hypothetical protein